MSDVFSDEFLDSMRLTTDPIGEKAVASVLDKPKGQEWKINQILDHLVKNSDPRPEGLPAELDEFFDITSSLPSWADQNKICRGEKFFEAAGAECVTVLFCKSLPECYAAHRGAQVLFRTGRLLEKGQNIEPLQRRIVETAQFLLNVCAPGGLGPNGSGFITAQKVRLIHASIRSFLHHLSWDVAELGQPINQEDMAGTLLAFSLQTIEGLEILGLKMEEADKDAYLHLWNVVGYIMGIDERLLMHSLDDARKLWNRIRERQFGTSNEGIALNNSLIAFMESVLPGTALKDIPIVFMNQLMD